MTDAKKFMFDTNNFAEDEQKAKATLYSEEQLLLAKDQAFAQGLAEGAQEARKQQEEQITAALQKIAALAESLIQAEAARERDMQAEAVRLALRALRKVLPKFAVDYAIGEIENVILQGIQSRKDEARIAVTVPTAHLEALKGRIDALAQERGYPGKVILLADDGLHSTDCRIEWADGGAERIYEYLLAQIENAFAKAIAGLTDNGGQGHEHT